jgi:P-type Mg2+ transporter
VNPPLPAFWSIPPDQLLKEMETSPQGLSETEVQKRIRRYGFNRLRPHKQSDALTLLLSQFKSPIILILIFAAGLSLFLGDRIDALIILGIVLVSGLLGFWQERSAADAVKKLLSIVQVKAQVLRSGVSREISVEEVVPGDLVFLKAGDIIPGDSRILSSKDLFVDEATLTGETFPVEKMTGPLPLESPLAERTNSLFMGTHVISGSAQALVVRTGLHSEFGQISEQLRLRPPETEFEQGVRRFGYLLMEPSRMSWRSVRLWKPPRGPSKHCLPEETKLSSNSMN